MDKLTPQARSELMGRIKAKGTTPERALSLAARRVGLRPSARADDMEGAPDMVFKRARVAVFVDGCFWHGCPWHARVPQSGSSPYWLMKIRKNMERDQAVSARLVSRGWLCLRVWEHEIKEPGGADKAAARLAQAVAFRQS
jgi:DNA mismatch endonuclease (patch repair protein)